MLSQFCDLEFVFRADSLCFIVFNGHQAFVVGNFSGFFGFCFT